MGGAGLPFAFRVFHLLRVALGAMSVRMKAPKQRQVHSPEFKAKVGLEALRGMKTVGARAELVERTIAALGELHIPARRGKPR